MRLDKYLAESQAGQRKQVRSEIKEGNVSVNGVTIFEAAYEIDEEKDQILFHGKEMLHPGKRYIMFHKPAGCITARKDRQHKTVLDYFPESEQAGLFPVGRLDKDTEGLLLLTNDGDFEYYLMNPINHVKKTYYFWALGSISEEEKQQLEQGIQIQGEENLTKQASLIIDQVGKYDELDHQIPSESKQLTKEHYKQRNERYRKEVVSGYLTITEGKKHQVKRMLRAIGCYVITLKRTKIAELDLDETLKPGEYRILTNQELCNLGYKK